MSLEDALRRARVLAILRRADIGTTVLALFDQLYEAGIRAVEVTLDQPQSLDALRRLVAHAPPDVVVGAGTVVTSGHIDAVVDAGASFLVCPHLDESLIAHAAERGLPVLPGVTTGTEVAAARRAGATIVKLFPGGPLGPAYLRALRGPFPDVPFVPTGGIDVADVPGWLEAGALCVGIGGSLFAAGGVDRALGEVLGT